MTFALALFLYVILSICVTEFLSFQSKRVLNIDWPASIKILSFLTWPIAVLFATYKVFSSRRR